MRLKLSYNRKVSPWSKWEVNNTYPKGRWKPMVPNSLGLLAGPKASCKNAFTAFCLKCYAISIERAYTSTRRLVTHNFDLLKACGSNVAKIEHLLDGMIEDYRSKVTKVESQKAKSRWFKGRPRRVSVPKWFRIHWDGEFYSKPYAIAWARVIRKNPDISFWAYTRAFSVVESLADLANLTLYLSVDEFNFEEAKATLERNPWVKLAFSATTWDETEILAAKFDGERKGPRCPALTHKLAMVSDKGVGACIDCKMCVFGRNNVRFAVKH